MIILENDTTWYLIHIINTIYKNLYEKFGQNRHLCISGVTDNYQLLVNKKIYKLISKEFCLIYT